MIHIERGRAVIEEEEEDPTTTSTDDSLTGKLKLVILKEPEGNTFTIQLHAHDRSNDPSDNPVTLAFSTASNAARPIPGMYGVGQDYTTGDFTIAGVKKNLKVGNRLDVPHTITFSAATKPANAPTGVPDPVAGFWFAEKKVKEHATEVNGESYLPTNTTTGAPGILCPDNKKPTEVGTSTIASGCYTLLKISRTIGPIVVIVGLIYVVKIPSKIPG